MDRPWFDPVTGTLAFDKFVVDRPSYQKVVQDGIVTPDEYREQALLVAELFRKLEGLLAPEARQVATDALLELAVLHALSARARRAA